MAPISKIHHSRNLSNTRIIRLLRTFTAEELQELDTFLHTLYSTKYLELKIFACLMPLHPHFAEGTEVVRIYQQVHGTPPEEKKHITNLRNSVSDLYGYILQYLSWKESKTHSFESEMQILVALQKRKLMGDYHSRVKKVSNAMKKKKRRDFWYFLQQLQLQHLSYYSSEIEKLDNNSNWIAEAMEMLDQFYMLAKLRYSSEIYSRHNLLQESPDISFLEVVLDEFKKREWPDGHLTLFYFHAFQLVKEKEVVTYQRMLEQFKSQRVLSTREQFILWTYLLNFTSSQIRGGDSSYFREAYELYKVGLKKELFLIDGHFDENIFLNLVNIGCVLKAFQEIKVFIRKWGKFLAEDIQESILSLAQARLSFAQGHYEDTIAFCLKVAFKNDTHALQTKILEVRSYYEVYGLHGKKVYRKAKQLEAFISKNDNLNTTYLKACENFLLFFKDLIHQKTNKHFLERLEEAQPIMAKDWLASTFKAKEGH